MHHNGLHSPISLTSHPGDIKPNSRDTSRQVFRSRAICKCDARCPKRMKKRDGEVVSPFGTSLGALQQAMPIINDIKVRLLSSLSPQHRTAAAKNASKSAHVVCQRIHGARLAFASSL